MSFIDVADTILVEVVNILFGEFVEMTFHWLTAATIDATWLEGLADTFRQWNAADLFPVLSQNLANSHVKATDLSSATGLTSYRVQTGNVGGVSDPTGLPGNATLAVQNVTAKRGRSFRGRQYVPGIPLTALAAGDSNTVTGTFITAVLEAYTDLVDALGAYDATGNLVVASRYHDKAPRTHGVTTPIIAYTVNNKMDSQRRRLSGRGT